MQSKLYRFFSGFAAFFFAALSVSAQTSQTQYFVPQPFPRSPTATALEKYGTYQVNEYTGVPDISIPLYTIEAGGFKVPITLSYHASGNKVTDVASWAGLGWSVSAGGQITRRTMGLPDDGPNGYLLGNLKKSGTYSQSNEGDLIYIENVSKNAYDAKPDIYSYDFPGNSGKFFFDGTAANGVYPVRMIPYSPVNVQYALSAQFTLTHFTLTDVSGNRYLYGDGATEMTTSSSGGSPGITTASAWKIEKMISQNRRDTVSFSYQADTVYYPAPDGEIQTVTDNITILNSVVQTIFSPSYANFSTPGNNNVTSEMLPREIDFKNGKIVFDLNPTTTRTDVNVGVGHALRGLGDIKVYKYNYGNHSMELQKTIVFWQTNFVDPISSSKRLRLDSIQVLDKAGSVIQHYRFDYNTAVSLPDYTSKAQDFWGYFNNVNNSRLTPQLTIPWQPFSVNTPSTVTIGSDHVNGRLCDSTQRQAYILTAIHFPSGGYSAFQYQTNQYYNGDTLKLAGGLRIKTISSYDGINPTPVVKSYVYNSARPNFTQSLNNFGPGGADYFSTMQVHDDWENLPSSVTPTIIATANVRTFYSGPHIDLEGYDGATVAYPSVTEYIGTPGNNVGRIDYTFTDAKDQTSDASRMGNMIYISYYFARGQLLTKKEYLHKSDGSYQMVKSTTNTYNFYPGSNYWNVGLNIARMIYNDGSKGGNPMYMGGVSDDTRTDVFAINYYNIVSNDNYLTKTTTKVYDPSDTTKLTTSYAYYTYDDTLHQQIKQTSHADSKGNTHITVNKHPYDYLSGTTTNNAILDSMINRHMYGEVIEKWDSLRNVTTGVNAVTSGQLNQYKLGNITNTIVPSKISTLSVLQPLTNFVPSTVSSGNLAGDSRYVQVISFDQYDNQNNPIQYTPRNATPTSIIWDYQSEQPVAQVKNATTIYGSTTQVAYTGFEANGKGNWSFTGTPVFNASAPSGVMVYPLSSGSISLGLSIDNTKTYVLSCWSNNGAPTVNAGSSLTGTPLTTVNGWTYYEYTVPSGVSNVTVSGTTTIDELRLYPTTAQMTTYAYDPSGVVDISDTKGLNNSFEYDFAQRLKSTRDFYGNIVSNYGYHLYDQTVGNQAQSGTFTRNNCPANTTPGSLTYSVPANKYYSSTLASANADAIYDKNVNGQIKANANCGCPVIMVNFTLTNSSGLTGYQATFSGISTPYNFPSSGSTVIQVPQGTYATVSVNAVGSGTHNFSLTGQLSQNGVHFASFSNVSVITGSNLTLSVQ
jgi:hypothetical protein